MSWRLDLRHGLRFLVRKPGFTVPVLIILALGIGANTAVFSVMRGVLLSPLPYLEPDRLTMVWSRNLPEGHERFGVSSEDFLDWAGTATSFGHLAAFQVRSGTLTGGDQPLRVQYAAVTPGLAATLGVQLHGRAFRGREDFDLSVVISNALWRSRFGNDPDVLGRTLVLNGSTCSVIGVLPEGFDFPSSDVDLWLPVDVAREPGGRGARWLSVVGRLNPDRPVETAQSEMSQIAAALAREYPGSNAGWDVLVEPLRTAEVGEVRPVLLLIGSTLGIVLLLMCANLANLLLVRAGARDRELAVRAALGAGRGRVVRQLLTESLLLALAGGVISLPVAIWGVQLFTRAGADLIPRVEAIRLDAGLLLFTLALSAATGLLFGLLPAWHSTRGDLFQRLRPGAGTTMTRGRARTRAVLVAFETALAFVVLVGAGLLLRSFTGLLLVDPGFNPNGLMTMRIEPTRAPQPADPDQILSWYVGERRRAAAFYRDLIPRLETVPGVAAVSAINRMPITGGWWMSSLEIDGRRSDGPDGTFFTFSRPVLPGYFETMETPLLRGRTVEWRDDERAQPVAVVNETAARTYWPGEYPIGRRIRIPGIPSEQWITVVGVVADVRLANLSTAVRPTTYYPMPQAFEGFGSNWGMDLVVRRSGPTAGLGDSLRRVIQAANPDLPVFAIRPMRQVIDASIASERLIALLLGTLGGLTLLLATAGVYSVVSCVVGEKHREMGIRLALGATRWDIYRLTFGYGMLSVAAGIAVGLGIALLLTRFLAGLLFGVTPTDPATFIGLAAVLSLAALAAIAIPARRATRIDPMSTLREE